MRTLLIVAAGLAGGGGLASVAALVGYCLAKREPWWMGWLFIAGNVVCALGVALALAAGAWWLLNAVGVRAFVGIVGIVAVLLGASSMSWVVGRTP